MAAPLIHFDPNDPIGSVFAPIVGLPAWRVQRGYSSCLTLEFGEPHLEIREPHVASATVTSQMTRERLVQRIVKPRGEWHLWVYCCNWRISGKDMAECDSEDSFNSIDVAAQKLDGQRLANVFVNPSAGTSHFEFDLGGCLETWPDPPAKTSNGCSSALKILFCNIGGMAVIAGGMRVIPQLIICGAQWYDSRDGERHWPTNLHNGY